MKLLDETGIAPPDPARSACFLLPRGQVLFRPEGPISGSFTKDGFALDRARLPSGSVIWSDELNDDVKVYRDQRWAS